MTTMRACSGFKAPACACKQMVGVGQGERRLQPMQISMLIPWQWKALSKHYKDTLDTFGAFCITQHKDTLNL